MQYKDSSVAREEQAGVALFLLGFAKGISLEINVPAKGRVL